MAISSIHIKRSVNGASGHNSREHFSYSIVFPDGKNECDATLKEAYSLYRLELQKRSDAYTKRTGQKLQKKAVTQLSAVINLEQHHTLEDLEPIKAELETQFGTKVYQMSIHRDEGKLISKADGTEFYSGKDFFLNHADQQLFFDKTFTKPVPMYEYETKKNFHAHIEMMGLNEDGQAIRQKMNRTALQMLQTLTAKTLKMQRGKENISYTKEQMQEIITMVGKKSDYESTTLYAHKFNEVAKDLGYFIEKTKRKDTHDYKDTGANREQAKRTALAKQADVKDEIAKLREELKENGAERKDYAQLEQLNRDLQTQIKNKNLTIEDLEKQINAHKHLIIALESKNDRLNEDLLKKDEIINSTPNMDDYKEYVEKELKIKIEENITMPIFFQKLISTLKSAWAQIKELKEQITSLKVENDELRKLKSHTINEIPIDSPIDEHKKAQVDEWWEQQMANDFKTKPRS